MSMVIRQNVLDNVTLALKLVKIDMTDKENQLDAVSIKFGIAVKEMLGSADMKIQNFRKECKDSVVAIIAKLQDRSPLHWRMALITFSTQHG